MVSLVSSALRPECASWYPPETPAGCLGSNVPRIRNHSSLNMWKAGIPMEAQGWAGSESSTGVDGACPTLCWACAVGPILGWGSASKAAADVYPHNAGSRVTVNHSRREAQRRVRAPKRAWFILPLRAAACRLSSSLADICLLAGSSHGEVRGLLVSLLRRALIFPDGLVVKSLPASAGDTGDVGLIPGSGRSPGEGNSKPTPGFLPGKSTDRGGWWATVCGVAKGRTWLSD